MAQAGYFPGIIIYFSMWYRKQEQTMRMAIFCDAAVLAGAVASILVIIKEHLLRNKSGEKKRKNCSKENYDRSIPLVKTAGKNFLLFFVSND
jgi:hypothetical protein